MKCPCCKKEMEKGLMQSSRDLFWTAEPKQYWMPPQEENGDVDVSILRLTGNGAQAYLCRDCKQLLMGYTE